MSMRKLLLALLLLPTAAQADVTFFWRAESATLTSDDKSAGDTTGTVNGSSAFNATAMRVGTNGFQTVDNADSVFFDSASIFSSAVGSAGLFIQWKTALPTNGLDANGLQFLNSGSVTDVISLRTSGSDELRLQIRKNTAAGGTQVFLATTACNIAIDTWYFIVIRWDIANDDRAIECYDGTTLGLIHETSDLTTDLSTTEPAGVDSLRFGNTSTHASNIYHDNFFISQQYDEPIQNFATITSFIPTFTAGPTNGSFTNTTLPFTYTVDQNGTSYWAACTNSQTVTSFANLKTGTCSGGAAVGTGTDTATATVSDQATITGLVAGTTYDVYYGHESDIGGQSTVGSLPDRATTSATVDLSATNVVAAADGYTVSGTCTGSGTLSVEAVGCALADAAPTSNEIEAGQCGGGNAAILNASETWTTAVANDFLLTSANKPPRLDVYLGCTNGATDATVVTHAAEDRTPRSGFALIFPTTVATTSIFDLDSYFNPDFTANLDGSEYEDDTNESADCNVSFEADGDFVLTPVAAGDCDGKRTFDLSYEYGGSTTDGLFTAPLVGNFVTDDLVCNGNLAPQGATEPEDAILVLTEDAVMTALDLTSLFADPDSPSMTFTETGAGTIPTGTSLSGTGNKDWTGTPTTEDQTGQVLQFTATDECGDTVTFDMTVYVINTWTMPDCDSNTLAECSDEVIAAAPWRALDSGVTVSGYTCGSGQPFLTSGAQSPIAGAELTAAQNISVTLIGAIIPDLTGMTVAEAIAAIEAICP